MTGPDKDRKLAPDSVFLVKTQKGYMTRESFMDAAISLIAARGINGFSVGELCEKAGHKRTSFYNYFTSIDELITAVAVLENTAFLARRKELFGELQHGVARLCVNVFGFFKIASEETEWNQFVLELYANHAPTAENDRQAVLNDVHAAIFAGDFDMEMEDVPAFCDIVFGAMSTAAHNNREEIKTDWYRSSVLKLLLLAANAQPSAYEKISEYLGPWDTVVPDVS